MKILLRKHPEGSKAHSDDLVDELQKITCASHIGPRNLGRFKLSICSSADSIYVFYNSF